MSREKKFKDHDFFMLACLELALTAKQEGNSAVGSVMVKDGEIISRGLERATAEHDITYHAEIEAIRGANELLNTPDLSECILYTSHEPCIMCSYVIRHSRIHTVVIGAAVKDTGGVNSAYPILLDKTIKKWGKPPLVVLGILEKDCLEL